MELYGRVPTFSGVLKKLASSPCSSRGRPVASISSKATKHDALTP
jgi:hypothetical protein